MTRAVDPRLIGSTSSAKPMPITRWIRLVRARLITKPIIEVYSPTSARKAAMPVVFLTPLASAVAMFSCCSMMAAPMAAKAMTRAITCRCREEPSNWMASPLDTPSSSTALAASLVPAPFSRCRMNTTMARQSARVPAPIKSIVFVPTFSTRNRVSPLPRAPPRLEPAPTNPNTRLAWRGS